MRRGISARRSAAKARSPSCIFPACIRTRRKWLVANRTVKAVGIDTASIDYGQSTLFETHRVLYERNIPGLENLTQPGPAARARRDARRAADEDQRRQRRAAAGDRDRAVAIFRPRRRRAGGDRRRLRACCLSD